MRTFSMISTTKSILKLCVIYLILFSVTLLIGGNFDLDASIDWVKVPLIVISGFTITLLLDHLIEFRNSVLNREYIRSKEFRNLVIYYLTFYSTLLISYPVVVIALYTNKITENSTEAMVPVAILGSFAIGIIIPLIMNFKKNLPESILIMSLFPLCLPLFFASYTIDLLSISTLFILVFVSLFIKIKRYKKDKNKNPIKLGYFFSLLFIPLVIMMVFGMLSTHQKVWKIQLRSVFQESGIRTLKDLDPAMQNFYQNPTEEDFREIETGVFNLQRSINGHPAIIMSVFLGTVANQNDWELQREGDIFTEAEDVKNNTGELSNYLRQDNIVSAQKLDFWWSQFFGTGNEAYLENIYTVIGTGKTTSDVNLIMTAGAAEWSFKINFRNHEVIRQFVQKKIETETDSNKLTYLESLMQS